MLLLLCFALACRQEEPEQSVATEAISPLATLPQQLNEAGISLDNPKGLLILSEGNFSSEAGHLSFVDQAQGTIANGIVQAVNARRLGSVAQDLAVYQGRLYVLSQNGDTRAQGQMKQIAVFDKSFRHIEDYDLDIAIDPTDYSRPRRIGISNDRAYIYFKEEIYECALDSEPRGDCYEVDEISQALDERLYTIHQGGKEYLMIAGKRNIYRLGRNLEVSSFALPYGQRVLAMAVAPKLADRDDIYTWVLVEDEAKGSNVLVKLRNLEQEAVYDLPLRIAGRQPQDISLLAIELNLGTALVFKEQGQIYRFNTWDKTLHSLYTSGNGGRNKLYGMLGLSPRRGSIYFSEFTDYAQFAAAWVGELDLMGRVRKTYPVSPATEVGLSTSGLYTPFCAGIYPIEALYTY